MNRIALLERGQPLPHPTEKAVSKAPGRRVTGVSRVTWYLGRYVCVQGLWTRRAAVECKDMVALWRYMVYSVVMWLLSQINNAYSVEVGRSLNLLLLQVESEPALLGDINRLALWRWVTGWLLFTLDGQP
jgi:hypothetical protein